MSLPARHPQILPLAPAISAQRRILLAEDNAVNLQITLAMLRPLNIAIDTVTNGKDAVAAVGCQSYDLVLMDYQMPDMDGLEATRQIRARFPQAAVPIVALTASAMQGDRERCHAAGMSDYLSKPFRTDQLQGMVLKWLNLPA